jgi:hypothetical protein
MAIWTPNRLEGTDNGLEFSSVRYVSSRMKKLSRFTDPKPASLTSRSKLVLVVFVSNKNIREFSKSQARCREPKCFESVVGIGIH